MVLHFLVQGRVQGVGFRWYVHREASELDLRGWVRNTEDGEVEVVAHGDAANLAELRASLKRGPRGSRVDRVIEHYLDESEAEGLGSFRIDGAWLPVPRLSALACSLAPSATTNLSAVARRTHISGVCRKAKMPANKKFPPFCHESPSRTTIY